MKAKVCNNIIVDRQMILPIGYTDTIHVKANSQVAEFLGLT